MDENKTPHVPEQDAAEEAVSLDLTASRRERVSQFRLQMEEQIGQATEETASPGEEYSAQDVPTAPPAAPKKKKKRKKKSNGCLKGAVYIVLVVLFSVTLAAFALLAAIDVFGFTKPKTEIDVTIEEGWYGGEIAQALEESGIIDYPFLFRVYCRLTGADGTMHPGVFTLRPDMGYEDVISTLQVQKQRETVNVTIPEGFTVDKIAALLEKNNVCTRTDFYRELGNWRNYGQFDFIKALIDAETADPNCFEGRIYMLEGYLFPDTYNFYVNCSASSVVRKMLENFDTRVTTSLRSALSAQGWTMDEAVIIASIIQREADATNMDKVSRVLLNRLNNTAQYPKLECCSTRDYINAIMPPAEGVEVTKSAYNTYLRTGLPVGAICNPGVKALEALAAPSQEKDVNDCYFFATDYNTGKTYFSKTYKQHEAICKKYKIGMYG